MCNCLRKITWFSLLPIPLPYFIGHKGLLPKAGFAKYYCFLLIFVK